MQKTDEQDNVKKNYDKASLYHDIEKETPFTKETLEVSDKNAIVRGINDETDIMKTIVENRVSATAPVQALELGRSIANMELSASVLAAMYELIMKLGEEGEEEKSNLTLTDLIEEADRREKELKEQLEKTQKQIKDIIPHIEFKSAFSLKEESLKKKTAPLQGAKQAPVSKDANIKTRPFIRGEAMEQAIKKEDVGARTGE